MIKNAVEEVMHRKSKDGCFSLPFFLQVLSKVYGRVVATRRTCYRRGIFPAQRLPCMVISIGNITVGGTGKTPMAIYVAELIKSMGYSVAMISRGYKGKAEKTGGLVSDGRNVLMGFEEAGDEPLMLAEKLKGIPVLIGQDRYRAGMLAIKKFSPDVVVLDDGFQHLKLKRDVDLVLLDFSHPFGNGHLLPRGLLREPLSALDSGDVFILTRTISTGVSETAFADRPDSVIADAVYGHKPIFNTFHVPYIATVVPGTGEVPEHCRDGKRVAMDSSLLRGKKVVAFSGIAGNNDFQGTIKKYGCQIKAFLTFPDHHRYTGRDFEKILGLAKTAGASFLATTEKDYMRIKGRLKTQLDLVVVGIAISFGKDTEPFNAYLGKKIELFQKKNREKEPNGLGGIN